MTSDRNTLAQHLKKLPHPIGGSPLWDTIALAYDDELAALPGERNALVVISDGIDNRISGHNAPSILSASRLIQAAAEMDTRIYPIFLLSGERFGRNWAAKARRLLESLAQRTGGRLFTARSVADIEPVLPALAREMRSVYEIAYYPADQEFNGSWRRVKVKVGLPGAQVRARPGYFAE
ncbi:MAG: VWA domain-containing protein [Bryobacterales bacterium]|nr:VWA domain-containing protein [Bryobacterales bacterium]